jgi:hypothetical protein
MCQLTITHHATFLDIFADRKGKPHISLPVCLYFTGLGQKHDDGFGCVKITFLTYALSSFVFECYKPLSFVFLYFKAF